MRESKTAEYVCEDFIHSMRLETKKLKQSFEFGSSAGIGGVSLKLQRKMAANVL